MQTGLVIIESGHFNILLVTDHIQLDQTNTSELFECTLKLRLISVRGRPDSVFDREGVTFKPPEVVGMGDDQGVECCTKFCEWS